MSRRRDQVATESMLHEEPRAPSGCVLYVFEGEAEDLRRYFVLRRGTALVGASAKSDLVLQDPKVSRRHLEVTVQPEGIGLRDLGSTNGTRVMGTPVTGTRVVPLGAHVQLGGTTLALLPLEAGGELTPAEGDAYGELRGVSLVMRRVFALLQRLEGTDVPVLITGETGTGKELVARALHDKGARPSGPFVVLDCGAVPRQLIESEIFGHAAGAFTGAARERIGVVEQASGGTLFIDEVGELPVDLQTRLLRVLDRHEIKRVGENHYRPVHLRVVAATHRRLGELIARGEFREDLFYRLAVATIALPPLRERLGDVEHLAALFAQQLDVHLDSATLAALAQHPWSGNVRELRAAVLRVATFGTWLAPPLESSPPEPALREELPQEKPPPAGTTREPFHDAKQRLLDGFEVAYVRELLARNNGNVSAAAREAGVSRKHLRELIKKHGLVAKG